MPTTDCAFAIEKFHCSENWPGGLASFDDPSELNMSQRRDILIEWNFSSGRDRQPAQSKKTCQRVAVRPNAKYISN